MIVAWYTGRCQNGLNRTPLKAGACTVTLYIMHLHAHWVCGTSCVAEPSGYRRANLQWPARVQREKHRTIQYNHHHLPLPWQAAVTPYNSRSSYMVSRSFWRRDRQAVTIGTKVAVVKHNSGQCCHFSVATNVYSPQWVYTYIHASLSSSSSEDHRL